jgi:hypothetical protein
MRSSSERGDNTKISSLTATYLVVEKAPSQSELS